MTQKEDLEEHHAAYLTCWLGLQGSYQSSQFFESVTYTGAALESSSGLGFTS
jgi:hypothetical protein